MSQVPYVHAQKGLEAFNCIHCGAFSVQSWRSLLHDSRTGSFHWLEDWKMCQCFACNQYSIWFDSNLIYPDCSIAELPHVDLSEVIKADFNEARSIVNKSPRGAAAILRLCVQKLMVQLGEKGKNLNDDIGALVKKGLPIMVQQMLDAVRVIGNNAVHPGEIDMTDNRELALQLFRIINLVADKMIAEPKRLHAIYGAFSPGVHDAIAKRDATKSTT